MKHWRFISLLTLIFSVFLVIPLYADTDFVVNVQESRIESDFGDHITAYLEVESDREIVEVEFFYRALTNRTPVSKRNVPEFEPGTQVTASYSIDQQSNYFPPGTELEYWWRFTDADGNRVKTDSDVFLHMDNRYEFRSLSNERISLYWYHGSDNFGETIFNRANDALNQLETDFGAGLDRPVRAFIYNGARELRDALGPGSNEWTGGVAYSDYGVIAIGITPNNLDWGLRATTHELAHLVIHQVTANPYGDIPRWLDEGLAVYSESPGRLESQFRMTLDSAIAGNDVMTLQTLSSSFPADARAANLAYAQSGAVVMHIIDTYGKEGIADLLDIFSEGALYDQALEDALGVDTQALDAEWRESVGLPALPNTRTDLAPAPEVESPAEAQPESLPATPEPQINDAPQTSSEPQALPLPCLSSSLPLMLLGLALGVGWRRKL